MLGIFVEKVILGIWHAFVSSFDPSQNVLEIIGFYMLSKNGFAASVFLGNLF